MKLSILVPAAVVSFLSTAAFSEIVTNDLIANLKSNSEEIRNSYNLYLRGTKEGLIWANSDLQFAGRQKLFCQPRNLALTDEQAASILERKVNEIPQFGEMYVGVVLLLALKDVFPCPE